MDKFCIFCGNPAKDKSLEHVIPRWLIKLTGDSNRKAIFGFNYKKAKEFNYEFKNIKNLDEMFLKFSFDAFNFPACNKCNNDFSIVEDKVKDIIISILSNGKLSSDKLNILLDWLDKIRIGIWLGFYYLHNNPYGAIPELFIASRVGINDRFVAIYKSDIDRKRLTIIGNDTPFYYHCPSCITLIINNVYLFNVSYNFLFCRRIGFPYPGDQISLGIESGRAICDMKPGLKRYLGPLVRGKDFLQPCSEIYQPMFAHPNIIDQYKELYNDDYVRTNCINWDKGIGHIFIQKFIDGKYVLIKYPMSDVEDWIPQNIVHDSSILHKMALQTLSFQDYILRTFPSIDALPQQERIKIKQRDLCIKRVNKIYSKFYKKLIQSKEG